MVKIKWFLIGLGLFIWGLIMVFKNKAYTRGIKDHIIKNVYGEEVGESKGLSIYLRIKYYIGGIIFMLVGLIMMRIAFS